MIREIVGVDCVGADPAVVLMRRDVADPAIVVGAA